MKGSIACAFLVVIGGCLTATVGWAEPAGPADPAPAVAAVAERTPQQRRSDFYLRLVGPLYREHGRRDERWDAAALRLMESYCRWMARVDFPLAPPPPGTPTAEEIRDQRQAVLDAGCQDELMLYICALLDESRNGLWEKPQTNVSWRFTQSVKKRGLMEQHLWVFLLLERQVVVTYKQANHTSKKWEEEYKAFLLLNYKRSLRESFPLTDADQIELATLADWYVDGLSDEQLRPLLEEAAKAPESRRWLAHVVTAMAHVEMAWNARGSGWVGEVKDEGWDGFAHHLGLAERECVAAWALEPGRAQPARMMIIIAMGQGSGQERLWFDRAVAADPLASEPYEHLKWAMRPRWGGDVETVLAVGQAALATGRFDTHLPNVFFDSVLNLETDLGPDWLGGPLGRKAWPDIERYLDGRAAHPTPKLSADWSWSQGFALAHRAGRDEAMWRYFDRLGRDPRRFTLLHARDIDRRWTPGLIHSRREDAVWSLCRRAEALSERGEHAKAAALLQVEALPRAAHPWTRTHVRDRARIQRWLVEFLEGRDVDLLAHGLEGWRETRGMFHSEPGRIVGEFKAEYGGLRLTCGFDPGSRYVAELDVEVPEGFHAAGWGGVGFVLAPVGRESTHHHPMVLYSRSPDSAVVISPPRNNDKPFGASDGRTRATLRLERWDNAVRVTCNGRVVVERYDFPDEWPERDGLALGVWHESVPRTYRFHSLRVRKLDAPPFEQPAPGGGAI